LIRVEIERRVVDGALALELLGCTPATDSDRAPLLFVHGAYVGAWCWAEHWLPWFAAQGYPAYAPSLRGHGRSAGRERLNAFGLADYSLLDGLGHAVMLETGWQTGARTVLDWIEVRGDGLGRMASGR